MARRREATVVAGRPGGVTAAVPVWVVEFAEARWSDSDDQPPAEWDFGPWVWRDIRARERWSQASREWLAQHGFRGSWYHLIRDHARNGMEPVGVPGGDA